MIVGFFHFIWKAIWNSIVILLCAGLVFIGFKSNQPMSVSNALQGMTYIEFMQDRMKQPKRLNLQDAAGE